MSNTVLVGCKLPNGVVLHGTKNQPIHINGMNTSLVAGGYGITTVDAVEWAYIEAIYADYAPVVSKAIFSHGTANVNDVIDMAGDLRNVKTGLEGMNPENPAEQLGSDARKMEFEPEGDGQNLGKQLEANEVAKATGSLPRKRVAKVDAAAALAVAQAEVGR